MQIADLLVLLAQHFVPPQRGDRVLTPPSALKLHSLFLMAERRLLELILDSKSFEFCIAEIPSFGIEAGIFSSIKKPLPMGKF